MVLVLVVLAIALAVVATVAVIGFIDVAFHPPEYSRAVAGLRPATQNGRTTFEWFSATAERLTRSLIAARRDAGEAHHAGGTDFGAAERPCREYTHEPITSGFCLTRTEATPPEAFEIAQFLRKTQSVERVDAIRRDAAANARWQLGPDQLGGARARVRCPLACDDGTCLAMPVRPIQCRVRCALFGHEVAEDNTQAAADGAEDGLRKALAAAGLGDELYELNGALATALSIPDAAERWASGENPFAECMTQTRS